jgi:hypothetical protein
VEFRREITCTRCGNPHLQKATVIVQSQTSSGTVRGFGSSMGQSVQTSGTVETQTDLARNLSADKPHKEVNWIGLVCGVVALLSLCICAVSLLTPTQYIAGQAGQGQDPGQFVEQAAALVLVVIAYIALPIGIIIGNKKVKKSNSRKYNQWWWNVLDHRYYCNSCGNIINV